MIIKIRYKVIIAEIASYVFRVSIYTHYIFGEIFHIKNFLFLISCGLLLSLNDGII